MLTVQEAVKIIEELNERTVFKTLGIKLLSADLNAFQVGITVDERHLQHVGFVHGGIYVLLAESAASISAAIEADITKNQVFGMEINANHLRPVQHGQVVATAKPIFKGKTTAVYGIEIHDGLGNLVSVSRCTIAIRPRKEQV